MFQFVTNKQTKGGEKIIRDKIFQKADISMIKEIPFDSRHFIESLDLPLTFDTLEQQRKTADRVSMIRIKLRDIILFSTNGRRIPECRNWVIKIDYDLQSLHSVEESSKFEYALCQVDKYDPRKIYTDENSQRVKFRVFFFIKSF